MAGWKPILFLVAAAPLLLEGCGASRDEPPETRATPLDAGAPERNVRVEFAVNFFPVQKALWVEDADGNYQRSLHVSEWVSVHGEEYEVLPRWVEASSAARGSKNAGQVDAFTGATLRAGPERVSYYWDLTDWQGNRVPDGIYRVILQCDGAEGIVITWSAEIEVGEEPSVARAWPDPPEHPEGLEMYVRDVAVSFHP